ncbi:unnamed protein product [Owenia fusiformis]|uniref:VWFA domain-containing protein n=1 Tax=Owenia fusiformis TaxID=6347 RepID=A0A8S4MTS6_OWEFU|nr:unnamed protein product [Owenia fusiformis]
MASNRFEINEEPNAQPRTTTYNGDYAVIAIILEIDNAVVPAGVTSTSTESPSTETTTETSSGTNDATETSSGTTEATEASSGTNEATEASSGTTEATEASSGTNEATEASSGTTESTIETSSYISDMTTVRVEEQTTTSTTNELDGTVVPAIPDGGLPDGGLPDGGLPDGGLPDGGLPDLPGGGDGGARDCVSIGRDIVFACDTSFSVSLEDQDAVRQFLNNLIDELAISKEDSQVGMLMYNKHALHGFYLNDHYDNEAIKTTINTFFEEPRDRKSRTDRMFKAVNETYFRKANGDRKRFKNALVVFTDGFTRRAARASVATRIANHLKNKRDVDIFIIGLENEIRNGAINMVELETYASTPLDEHLFTPSREELRDKFFAKSFQQMLQPCTETSP